MATRQEAQHGVGGLLHRRISRRAIIKGGVVGGAGLGLAAIIGYEKTRGGGSDQQVNSVASGSAVDADKASVSTNVNDGKGSQSEKVVLSKAPDFEAKALNGETVRLSDYRGRPVLLFFWQDTFVTGGPEYISKEIQPKFRGVVYISVVTGHEATARYSLRSIESDVGKVNYPVIFDEKFELALSKFKVSGTPAYVVVNEKGEIAGKIDQGGFDEMKEKLQLLLEKLTQEQPGQK